MNTKEKQMDFAKTKSTPT